MSTAPFADASRPQASPEIAGIDSKAIPRVLGRLVRSAARYPVRCALAVACALGASIFNLVTPSLLGHAIDQTLTLLEPQRQHAGGANMALFVTGLGIVGACAVRGLLTGLQGYLGEEVAQRVGYDLRMAYFEKLQCLDFGYHDGIHSGDLVARGMLDLEGVRAFLESGLLRVITLVMLTGIGAWHLLGTDASMGLLALSFVPFVAWRAARMGVRLRLSWQRLQRMMSDMTLTMEENLQGVRVVRAFASTRLELAKFDTVSEAALALSNQRITTRTGAMSTMNFAYYLSMGLVLYVGSGRVAAGTLTVGTLTEFLAFIAILQQPVRQVGMIVNSGARAASSGARLFEVLDAEPAIRDKRDARDLVLTNGTLRFESVGFGYAGPGAKQVLADISFEVGPGKTLGVVGPPGSGKSTLAHLVPRFYDVTSGRITIDGQDIRDVTLHSLRKAVGLVQQEIFLFDTSVRDNVAYPAPDAEEDRILQAAGISQVHDHIAGLPAGYDTRVGERGVALSGGQRQRLSIARGLIDNPAILIMDDSTAAVDTHTERQVRAALHASVQTAATIVIAHRLSSLMRADEIIVLDDGRIVERGTHAALLAAQGAYARLWALQNRAANPNPDAAHRLQGIDMEIPA